MHRQTPVLTQARHVSVLVGCLCFAMSLPDDAKMLVLDPAWLPTSVAYCCQDDLSDLQWDMAYFYDKLREEGFENSRTAFKFYSWCEDVVSKHVSLFNAGSEVFKRGPQPRLGLSKSIMIVTYLKQRPIYLITRLCLQLPGLVFCTKICAPPEHHD